MSYDRETRKKRLASKLKKKARTSTKEQPKMNKTFKQIKQEYEEKNNRKMRDSEILAEYFNSTLSDDGDDNDDVR